MKIPLIFEIAAICFAIIFAIKHGIIKNKEIKENSHTASKLVTISIFALAITSFISVGSLARKNITNDYQAWSKVHTKTLSMDKIQSLSSDWKVNPDNAITYLGKEDKSVTYTQDKSGKIKLGAKETVSVSAKQNSSFGDYLTHPRW